MGMQFLVMFLSVGARYLVCEEGAFQCFAGICAVFCHLIGKYMSFLLKTLCSSGLLSEKGVELTFLRSAK
jgi:hypothetical protein